MRLRPTGRVFVEHEYEENGLGCGLWVGYFVFGFNGTIALIISLFLTGAAFIHYHLTK